MTHKKGGKVTKWSLWIFEDWNGFDIKSVNLGDL